MLKTLSFLLSSFVIQAHAFQMGELITGGTGCFGSSKIVAVSGTEGRYVLPLRVRVNKKSEATFDRKSCQIRLPIDLNPNEKLQLLDLSQVVRVVGQKNLDIKTK